MGGWPRHWLLILRVPHARFVSVGAFDFSFSGVGGSPPQRLGVYPPFSGGGATLSLLLSIE